jgi:hypothetical protein
VAVFVLVPVAVLAACAALWLGVRWGAAMMFWRNDRFAIRHLDIRAGTVITADLVREYTRIEEGMNLFAVDIGAIRRAFLQQAPNVRSISIARQLPDTLQIEIVERVPLARIGRRGFLVTDREGSVFGVRSPPVGLPYISGYRGPALRPGDRLAGMAQAALEVLDVCDNPRLGLRVESVEVHRDDYLVVRLVFDDRMREVDLAWDDMGRRTKASRRRLLERLEWVKRTLESPRGANLSHLDATFADRIVGRRTPG